MIKTVKTRFSTYELDEEKGLIRRLSGEREPTQRQGQDGDWQPYYLAAAEVGLNMVIQYKKNDSRATITSPVVEISTPGESGWTHV